MEQRIMVNLDIRPTRIELIRTTRRIKFAKRGLDLLKMKRSSLVMEFFAISRTVKGMRENLRNDVLEAMERLKMAEILHGAMAIELIAYMTSESKVGVTSKNVMGVRIPELKISDQKTVLSNAYRATSVPVSINDAIKKFEKVYNQLLDIAEKENSMRKLLYEIDKTKRRANAIENVLIPSLVDNAKYIRMRLDEIERDTFITLKTIKKKMVEKQSVQAGD
jgi:V/A-type H+-transporting ATPase subunit D